MARSPAWRGVGKWAALTASAMLVLIAVLQIVSFQHALAAVAGWNLVLGLLILGAILSAHKRAPALLIGVAILMAVRLTLALLFTPMVPDRIFDLLLCVLTSVAAYDLRRQALVE